MEEKEEPRMILDKITEKSGWSAFTVWAKETGINQRLTEEETCPRIRKIEKGNAILTNLGVGFWSTVNLNKVAKMREKGTARMN